MSPHKPYLVYHLNYTHPQPHQRTSLQKTSHDFQMSLAAFQRAQQVSAERQRTVVEGVKMAVEDEHKCALSTSIAPTLTIPQPGSRVI